MEPMDHHGSDRGPHGHADRDAHGNPLDLASYFARLESPERAAWQKPDEVVVALGLKAGEVAADVGCGPGYFTLRLARAVGTSGQVFGLDVDARMTEALAVRAQAAGLHNVVPLLATADDGLPPRPCDLVLVVNAFHHFTDRTASLRRLAGALAPGGRMALLEFHSGELPVGPPPEFRVTRGEIDACVAAAGLTVAAEHGFLPYQHFLLLVRA
jgi:SAM-dependent methyltransferase